MEILRKFRCCSRNKEENRDRLSRGTGKRHDEKTFVYASQSNRRQFPQGKAKRVKGLGLGQRLYPLTSRGGAGDALGKFF